MLTYLMHFSRAFLYCHALDIRPVLVIPFPPFGVPHMILIKASFDTTGLNLLLLDLYQRIKDHRYL